MKGSIVLGKNNRHESVNRQMPYRELHFSQVLL